MSILTGTFDVAKNFILNTVGVERDLEKLLTDHDVQRARSLFQDRSIEVAEAVAQYNPDTHEIMRRPDKQRKGREPYIVQKLPRNWQGYINEIALFFLLGNPIKWSNDAPTEKEQAFNAFLKFLKDTRFNITMRQAKRLAGAETESAKLYHIYRDETTFEPKVKVIVLSKSEGYTLHPLIDQYKNLVAFGYGYFLKENGSTVEHFDVQTPTTIFKCRRSKIGWMVTRAINPTGKINVIYYRQNTEWHGAKARINRDESVDSKTADINEYFADPQAAATADVIQNLADPETIGKIVKLTGPDSRFEYINPPTASDMKEGEKKVLKESILQDTFTPDFSYENLQGMGTLSGEALRRALILGFIKRANSEEVYDIAVDREANLILAIMTNITHPELKDELLNLNLQHTFAEPFNEDADKKITIIGTAYQTGVISLEQAVHILGLCSDPAIEIKRIKKAKQQELPKDNTRIDI